MPPRLELPAEAFAKQDSSPDPLFYVAPRFVAHVDAGAIAAVTSLYRAMLPAGGVILDLMSSWISHLPEDVSYNAVIGHGLNAQELGANPRLTRFFVQDLNRMTNLPLQDASVDAVTMCVSVQYLQHPVAVMAEVRRILRRGTPVIITFSNRCFPTKAVAVWKAIGEAERVRLVQLYLRMAGLTQIDARSLLSGDSRSDPLYAVTGSKGRDAEPSNC